MAQLRLDPAKGHPRSWRGFREWLDHFNPAARTCEHQTARSRRRLPFTTAPCGSVQISREFRRTSSRGHGRGLREKVRNAEGNTGIATILCRQARGGTCHDWSLRELPRDRGLASPPRLHRCSRTTGPAEPTQKDQRILRTIEGRNGRVKLRRANALASISAAGPC
jgi:hypothetical protein